MSREKIDILIEVDLDIPQHVPGSYIRWKSYKLVDRLKDRFPTLLRYLLELSMHRGFEYTFRGWEWYDYTEEYLRENTRNEPLTDADYWKLYEEFLRFEFLDPSYSWVKFTLTMPFIIISNHFPLEKILSEPNLNIDDRLKGRISEVLSYMGNPWATGLIKEIIEYIHKSRELLYIFMSISDKINLFKDFYIDKSIILSLYRGSIIDKIGRIDKFDIKKIMKEDFKVEKTSESIITYFDDNGDIIYPEDEDDLLEVAYLMDQKHKTSDKFTPTFRKIIESVIERLGNVFCNKYFESQGSYNWDLVIPKISNLNHRYQKMILKEIYKRCLEKLENKNSYLKSISERIMSDINWLINRYIHLNSMENWLHRFTESLKIYGDIYNQVADEMYREYSENQEHPEGITDTFHKEKMLYIREFFNYVGKINVEYEEHYENQEKIVIRVSIPTKKVSHKNIDFSKIYDTLNNINFYINTETLRNFHAAVITPPRFIILSGPPGTGKTALSVLYAGIYHGILEADENHKMSIEDAVDMVLNMDPYILFVRVKPGWIDTREFIGYKDIHGNERNTEVYKFLRSALSNPSILHFLILDEMNLSHPEHYLADILSAMETGGEIYTDFGPIKYPKNLAIIGTINQDETTQNLSPRLLSRSIMIEMRANWDLIKEESEIKSVFESIDMALKKVGLGIGFREYQRAKKFLDKGGTLDQYILSKIIPRIRGTRDIFIIYDENHRGSNVLESIAEVLRKYNLNKSHSALKKKIKLLETSGYIV